VLNTCRLATLVMVHNHVCALVRQYFKVIRVIVMPVTVFMVHYLAGLQLPP